MPWQIIIRRTGSKSDLTNCNVHAEVNDEKLLKHKAWQNSCLIEWALCLLKTALHAARQIWNISYHLFNTAL
jgi:hypothetical protein